MLSPPPCVRVRVLVWQRNICAYAVVIVLWRWRRGRQRRNMTHGKLLRSSESGSRVWPQLWGRARSLRWKPPCISARSFARLARSPAAHPGQPAAPLASWPRMRVYVCYNNVAKGLAAELASWHFEMGEKNPVCFSVTLTPNLLVACTYLQSLTIHAPTRPPVCAHRACITRIFQARWLIADECC